MIRVFAIGAAFLMCTAAFSGAQDSRPPAGDHSNPYRTTIKWGTLPEGRMWGGVSAIDIDRDGRPVCGIWVGNVADGKVIAFLPDLTPDANPITAAEGVAVAADGTVYGGAVPAQMVQKHSRAR